MSENQTCVVDQDILCTKETQCFRFFRTRSRWWLLFHPLSLNCSEKCILHSISIYHYFILSCLRIDSELKNCKQKVHCGVFFGDTHQKNNNNWRNRIEQRKKLICNVVGTEASPSPLSSFGAGITMWRQIEAKRTCVIFLHQLVINCEPLPGRGWKLEWANFFMDQVILSKAWSCNPSETKITSTFEMNGTFKP